MLKTKEKRKLLAEIKQLKVRQKCIEKSMKLPKLNDLEEDELEFLKEVEKLKAQNEKRLRQTEAEAKATIQESFGKIHKFIETVSNHNEKLGVTKPSDLLRTMSEINAQLTENLFISKKELASLKHQNEQCK